MSTNENGDSPMQRFELYIKASAIDKETKGSCPICQQFFMMTFLLGENQDDIDFKVFTVQVDCPPKNFAPGWSKKYPVVCVNEGRSKTGQDLSGLQCDTFEELEQLFESINKECPHLKRKNAPNIEAMRVVENIYKHFNHFIAGQPEKGLLGELKKLNDYLEQQDTKFLVDNVLSFADCHLLPRLQHIVVAGEAYRGFRIPKEFIHVWKYLKDAYEQDAFTHTLPSNQDLIYHYEKKATGPARTKGKQTAKPTLEKFTYTKSVPDDILPILESSSSSKPEQVPEEEPTPEPYQEQKLAPVHHTEPYHDTDPSSCYPDEEEPSTHNGNIE